MRKTSVKSLRCFWCLLCCCLICSFYAQAEKKVFVPPEGVPVLDIEVLDEFPHNADAFCQGLLYANGLLYESTGRYGVSQLCMYEPDTGRVLARRSLPEQFFAEGITRSGDTIVQLTWKSGKGFIYTLDGLLPAGTFKVPVAQGWGIACSGDKMVMSDGTDRLYFLHPEAMTVVSKKRVRAGQRYVSRLNELEFYHDVLLANVWMSRGIAVIDPETVRLIAWIDMAELVERAGTGGREDVLNGIAWDKKQDRLFVTGKCWSKLFSIKVNGLDEVLSKYNRLNAAK